jgi:hypothetical protein
LHINKQNNKEMMEIIIMKQSKHHKKEEGHWPTCTYNQNIKNNGQQMEHNKNARKQAKSYIGT